MEDNHNREDELLKEAQAIIHSIKEIEKIDISHGYDLTIRKIRMQKNKRFIQIMSRYAAILFFPLFLSTLVLGWHVWNIHSEHSCQYSELQVANGAIMKHELPDGSLVWLNSGTRLKYANDFSSRVVMLDGEAYFEVKANPDSPFYVKTSDGMDVYVYGTHFNVNAYEKNYYVETTLEEGALNVCFPFSEQVRLYPQEKIFYDKKNKTYFKKIIDSYEYTAWKDGILIFRDTSLDDVLRRLAIHFNVRIVLRNHTQKEYKYRATFKDEGLSQILDYLSRSAEMNWNESVDDNGNKTIEVDLY